MLTGQSNKLMSGSYLAPLFSDENILFLIQRHFSLQGKLFPLPSYCDLNKRLETSDGKKFVVKIAIANGNLKQIVFENQVINHLLQSRLVDISVPELLQDRHLNEDIIHITDDNGQACTLRVMTYLSGELWTKVQSPCTQMITSLGSALGQLDLALSELDSAAGHRFLVWDIKHSLAIVDEKSVAISQNEERQLIQRISTEYEASVVPFYASLPQQIIHNDANDYNIFVNPLEQRVTGIIDFGDMVHSFRIAELAIAAAYTLTHVDDWFVGLKQLTLAYHQENPLASVELQVLLNMIEMRLAVSLCMSSYEYQQNPENEYLLISQKQVRETLNKISAIDKTSARLALQLLCEKSQKSEHSVLNLSESLNERSIIDYRRKHLSENLSLAYNKPLKIVAGKGAYLYDQQGNRYLDMVNNVCHVGHCHPKVVLAGQQQMAMLNTNTRYLHDNIIHFSKKLLATMPDELSVCMFVNSGSEANELALRLARTYTQRKSMVVVEGAYHGNTNGCIDISPYKFDGKGGMGAPDWVHKVSVADPYRGEFRGNTPEVGLQYADEVYHLLTKLEAEKQPVCAFICESIQGVGGQIIHPPEYLKSAYQYVRRAGGVCIADEVQVGMGRVGSHWWAFQTQEVVPDIVTIGKPLGNGHPLAAVVTTKAIADAFVTGMEYFNTFGGNPVSCAIGSAVIDAIHEEKLLAHATKVGSYLRQGLLSLQEKFPIIGDVRGLGLFIGVEFVKSRITLEPAVEQIDFVIETLKARGILLTTEGPLHNVLKIKPPLAFSVTDADFFLSQLASVLALSEAKI